MEHEILAPPPFDHNLIHFPKLSTCDVCNRARLCSKRVKSRRVANEELNLSEPDACGQQLACDHLIDFKSLRSNEHAVLISQMCCKLIQQFERSIPTRIQSQAFLGLKSPSYTIVRSDAAGEILKAVIENNWSPESSMPARFPHNSVFGA